MAADQLAAREPGLDDAAHFRRPLQHAAHVHHFGDPGDTGHGQHGAHVRRVEHGAGALQPRCRGHARGGEHQHAQWQILDRADGPLHTLQPQHVAEFVRIPADRGGTLGQYRLGVAARGDHRAFDVQVGVDQPRRHDARDRDDLPGVAPAARRMDAGDQRADQTDIGGPQFSSGHIGDGAPGDQHIERRRPGGGAHGTVSEGGVIQVGFGHAQGSCSCRHARA